MLLLFTAHDLCILLLNSLPHLIELALRMLPRFLRVTPTVFHKTCVVICFVIRILSIASSCWWLTAISIGRILLSLRILSLRSPITCLQRKRWNFAEIDAILDIIIQCLIIRWVWLIWLLWCWRCRVASTAVLEESQFVSIGAWTHIDRGNYWDISKETSLRFLAFVLVVVIQLAYANASVDLFSSLSWAWILPDFP